MKSFSFYIKSIRIYGICGCINFIKRIPKNIYRRYTMLRSIRPCTTTTKGLTLIAYFSETGSMSKVMRDLALKLKESGIPYQIYDYSPEKQIPNEDIKGILTDPNDFNFYKYTHILDAFGDGYFPPLKNGISRAHICFWEFEDAFKDIHFRTFDGNAFVAFSDFCANVFRKESPAGTQVHKIRYPFHFITKDIPSINEIRKKYNLKEKDFIVFFNFSYNSSYYRKNPDGIVRAFAKALGNKNDVKLVFKTMGSKSHPEKANELLKLAESLGVRDKVLTIDNYITQKDIYGLTNACDVYISLHRGEGFGLGIAEAMSLGKPVIVTDYSASTEFCNSNNSIPVPYETTPFNHNLDDHIDYQFVTTCAEPDIGYAAEALLKCYSNKEFRLQTGENARQFIAEYFSTENFKKSINTFLETK